MAKIACIGGGTGLAAVLSGLVQKQGNELSAITGMADSGGSSGILRDQLGALPPGDVLKALAALASDSEAAERILRFRWDQGVDERYRGHTPGNLLLTAMSQFADFLSAVRALEAVLECRGRVYPAYLDHVHLFAQTTHDREIRGEGKIEEWIYTPQVEPIITDTEKIDTIRLDPVPRLLPEAADAILAADLVVIGPGSFYTSLAAVLLVEGMREALSRCYLVHVVNLWNNPRETPGWSAREHSDKLSELIGRRADYIICNKSFTDGKAVASYLAQGYSPVRADISGENVYCSNLMCSDGSLLRHNTAKLASALVWLADSSG